MPIDFDILAQFGTTNERLREICTATPNGLDDRKRAGETSSERKARLERVRKLERNIIIRKKLEDEIQNHVTEGIERSLKNWRLYAAIDTAFDSSVISKMNIPLLMFAQGKLKMDRVLPLLEGTKAGQACVRVDDKGEKTIDLPKFVETECNLVRSIILRRWAAQKNKYSNLWPFYDYNSRSTGLVGKCRADVMSQRADIMADQFGYRAHDNDVVLDAMLYSFQLDFPRCAWEVEKSYRKNAAGKTEEYVAKEGVGWFNPHPSRTAWDINFPPSSINSDSGCEWMMFWDAMKFSAVDDNPGYFNKKSVGWSNKFWGSGGLWASHQDYFNHYGYRLTPPTTGEMDPSAANDQKSNVGIYSGSQRDVGVVVTNYFRKLVPKDYGIGEYPNPVWIRFVTASDNTIIFAEIYPSSPAAYLGINCRGSRLANVSMAMDILPYQQQMTNLLTNLMLLCQAELFKVFGINTDLLTPEQVKAIETHLKGTNWSADPLIVRYSLAKILDANIKPPENGVNPVTISETKTSQSINTIFEAIIKLAQFVERQVAMSPAESGQPAPREISATEVTEIANTTSSIYSSISDDIDEYRAAKKRIIYESTVACSKSRVKCPVKNRYTLKTIKAAGFEPEAGEDEDVKSATKRFTVIGTARSLVHDFIFTTRDGAERPVNTQAANTLVQLIGMIMSNPMIVQRLRREKFYELFNEVFRLSGAGVDLNLTVEEGDPEFMGADELQQLQQAMQEMQGYLQQMAGQLQKNAEDIAGQDQINRQQEEAIKGIADVAERLKKAVEDVEELKGQVNSTNHNIAAKLIESISYKDLPPSEQAQLAMHAGLTPAPMSERIKPEPATKQR